MVGLAESVSNPDGEAQEVFQLQRRTDQLGEGLTPGIFEHQCRAPVLAQEFYWPRRPRYI